MSDGQIEYQVRDRLSFTRFLGLVLEDRIPNGTTLWLFREKLAQAGLIDKLFDQPRASLCATDSLLIELLPGFNYTISCNR